MSDAERQEVLLRWWATSLDNTGQYDHEPISEYATRKLGASMASRTIQALSRRLMDCPAANPAQFRGWCYKQIDRIGSALASEGEPPTKRKNTKPLVCTQEGDVCTVILSHTEQKSGKVTELPWTFPADFLLVVQERWPFHLKRFPLRDKGGNVRKGRYYVSRKMTRPRYDGRRSEQFDWPAHELFLGLPAVKRTFDDCQQVEAVDGNFLNYCNANLRIKESSDQLDRAKVSYGDGYAQPRQKGAYGSRFWHEKSLTAFFHPNHYANDGQQTKIEEIRDVIPKRGRRTRVPYRFALEEDRISVKSRDGTVTPWEVPQSDLKELKRLLDDHVDDFAQHLENHVTTH